MNWFKRTASESLLQELILQVRDVYEQDILPEALDMYKQKPDSEIRQEIEYLKIEKQTIQQQRKFKDEDEQHQKWLKDVPPEIYQIGGTKAVDSYTYCASGSVEEVQETIRQDGGLSLTQGLSNVGYDDAALQGYNNIFAGCNETWAAVLARDYDYSGRFVYITFGGLPEDFYVAEDPNPMDKTNLPSSYVILSKQSIISSQNIEDIKDGGTWEEVLNNHPGIEHEFE